MVLTAGDTLVLFGQDQYDGTYHGPPEFDPTATYYVVNPNNKTPSIQMAATPGGPPIVPRLRWNQIWISLRMQYNPAAPAVLGDGANPGGYHAMTMGGAW